MTRFLFCFRRTARIAGLLVLSGLSIAVAQEKSASAPGDCAIFYKARGKGGFLGADDRLGIVNCNGSGDRTFDFNRPAEIGWGVYGFLEDGRALLMSIETTPEWKTKTFQEYYHTSRTHIWAFDRTSGALGELAAEERLTPFYSMSALIPNSNRMLIGVNFAGREQIYSMDRDGRNPVPVTKEDEYVYGLGVSPDATRIAFHANYRIHTTAIDGSNRVLVSGADGVLSFGTSWSPDGAWVLFQVCYPANDPGHDWSDIWIGRPDGSETRRLTEGQSAWFASSYGAPSNPGGGSIMPQWAPDGSGILFAQRDPGAKVPWEFQADQLDTTHFNRAFKPESARGGAHIAFIDPIIGAIAPVTKPTPGQWDFRPAWSSDSQRILFCRAGVGENPAIWIVNRDGSGERLLTRGIDDQGADFPRWIPE